MAVFDPWLIVYQITAMQCFYYLAMGTVMGLFHITFGVPISVDHFFNAEYVSFETGVGWAEVGCVLLSSVLGAILLALIVERAKKCVDFTSTLFIIHTIACWSYKEFPQTWSWWSVHLAAAVNMAVLGEYLCSRKELQDIPIFYTPV